MIHRLDTHHDPYPVWSVFATQTGGLAFDVGSNIGQSTKLLANGFERVVAFEPCTESFLILAEEMPSNVEAVPCAVSAFDGEVTLTETATNITFGELTLGEGLHWGPTIGHRTVPAMTLDSASDKWGCPDFVKVDTEGSEVEVLRGAQEAFARQPRCVIEVHREENEEIIRTMLPEYEWLKVVHPLRVTSPIRRNHFWLVDMRCVP